MEAEDAKAITAAHTVADQLRTAGIGARVWELDATALYADALPHGLVDGVVGWQRVDGDREIAAVSRFTCSPAGTATDSAAGTTTRATSGTPRPGRPPTTVSSLVPPEPDTGGTTPPGTTSTTTTTIPAPTRTIGTSAPARTSDVYGVCDPALDSALGRVPASGPGTASGPGPRVGSGEPAPGVDLATAGRLVDENALRIPLVRPAYLLAGDTVDTRADLGGQGAGARQVSEIFDAAPDWRRGR